MHPSLSELSSAGGRVDVAVKCNKKGRFSLSTLYTDEPWYYVCGGGARESYLDIGERVSGA